MSSRDLLILMLQFLEEERLRDTLQMCVPYSGIFFNSVWLQQGLIDRVALLCVLRFVARKSARSLRAHPACSGLHRKIVSCRFGQETGLLFSLKCCEELVMNGRWDELEKYISGFTKLSDNRYSMKMFFEIRKQKYLEALDRRLPAARPPLLRAARPRAPAAGAQRARSRSTDAAAARRGDRHGAVDVLVKDLRIFRPHNEEVYNEMTVLLTADNIRDNDKLANYRDEISARQLLLHELRKLIEQNPMFEGKLVLPNIMASRLRTLVHLGHQAEGNRRSDGAAGYPAGYPAAAGQAAGGAAMAHAQAAAPHSQLGADGGAGGSDEGGAAKRQRLAPAAAAAPAAVAYELKQFPAQRVRAPVQLSAPITSLAFHKEKPSWLLVGHSTGAVALLDLADGGAADAKRGGALPVAPKSEQPFSSRLGIPRSAVVKAAWGPAPDCNFYGVCFAQRLVQIWVLPSASSPLAIHIEMDAHAGAVVDLEFTVLQSNTVLHVVTGGEDGAVKVWDARNGKLRHCFTHDAPVTCVCPGFKSRINYVFSAYRDGNIKVWLLLPDQGTAAPMSPVYRAPGRFVTSMSYSCVEGSRMFSAGLGEVEGESSLVEWNEAEGLVINRFDGTSNRGPAAARPALRVVAGRMLALQARTPLILMSSF